MSMVKKSPEASTAVAEKPETKAEGIPGATATPSAPKNLVAPKTAELPQTKSPKDREIRGKILNNLVAPLMPMLIANPRDPEEVKKTVRYWTDFILEAQND